MSAGPDGAEDRRYSDREYELILRRAFELEERTPQTLPATAGLSIRDLRAVAVEVGLDPNTIERAAALVPMERAGTLAGMLGAPEAITFEMGFDGELEEDDYSPVLQAIRRVLRQRGESRVTAGQLDWKSVARTDHVFVTVTPRAGRTTVEVSADRRSALGLVAFFPIFGWTFAAAIAGSIIEPTGVLAIGALFGSGLVLAAATARVLWKSGTRRVRDAVERLADTLHVEVAGLIAQRRLTDGGGAEPDG